MAEGYTQEEANQILHRAVELQPFREKVSPEQLASIAGEIGVTPDILRLAESQWLAEHRPDSEARRQFLAEQRQALKVRLGFVAHCAGFLVGSTLLFHLNMALHWNEWWSIGIIFPWALGVGFHASYLTQSGGRAQEKAFRKWLRKRRPDAALTVPPSAQQPPRS